MTDKITLPAWTVFIFNPDTTSIFVLSPDGITQPTVVNVDQTLADKLKKAFSTSATSSDSIGFGFVLISRRSRELQYLKCPKVGNGQRRRR